MKIDIKTQTNRSTNWKEGYNCANLFLTDRSSNTQFQVGLQVTEWGSKIPIEPVLVVQFGGREYRLTINEFRAILAHTK